MDVSLAFLVLVVLFVISLNLNLLLYFKLRKAVKAPQPTLEAQKLLAAIAGGNAVLRITVIDPSDIFLKSPGR